METDGVPPRYRAYVRLGSAENQMGLERKLQDT